MDEHNTIFLIQDLLSIHSMQSSLESREFKDDICRLIFDLIENLIGITDFEKHIVENKWVYCWTCDKIEKLQKISDVYLCASKMEIKKPSFSLFNTHNFLYRLHIKENRYGVDLNSFFEGKYKIKEFDKERHWYEGNYHSDENEIIIRLKDIDKIERIK